MGTLYLDRRDLSLRLDGKRLVIEEPDARPRGVPLALLERVVMQGQVHFDSGALAALAEQGTSVVCLSARHSRRTAILVGPGHGDARRRLAQYQLSFDAAARLTLAKTLIAAKLQAQIRLLDHAQEQRPEVRKPLHDGLATIRALLPALVEAQDLATVLGLEGAGAAAHYAALTALFAPALNFTGRNRRPPRDPVNACVRGHLVCVADQEVAGSSRKHPNGNKSAAYLTLHEEPQKPSRFRIGHKPGLRTHELQPTSAEPPTPILWPQARLNASFP